MLSYELREQVLDYINNRIDLESLEDWYVPRLREFVNDPDSADAEVVAAIELAVVHLAADLQDEDDIKDMLWDVLSKHSQVMHLDRSSQQPSTDGMRVLTKMSAGVDNQSVNAYFPFKGMTVSYQR